MQFKKVWLITGISLLTLLIFSSATRAALGTINLQMKATIIANGCTVSANSQDKIVNMGSWASKQFSVNPQGVPPVPFTINLENCGAGASGVTATFSGTANSADSTLLAISGNNSAQNIGLAILDSNRVRIPLGKPSPLSSLTPNATSIALTFYGQYVATALPVTAGPANADATFTLDYQ